MTTPRLPTFFVAHGGGPWPWVDGLREAHSGMEAHLETLLDDLPIRPRALLVVSAHWEEKTPTIQSGKAPPLLFDYYGFPPHTYDVTWPAPGAPDLARDIAGLLQEAGFATAFDDERGFDHGTFVPMSLALPAADIPTLQLSLIKRLDPAQHLAMGRALEPLRRQGVLIIGSGMSYHNMSGFRPGRRSTIKESVAFDEWLRDCASQEQDARDTGLEHWLQAPHARACHPREEHLLPLHVVAGAAQDSKGTVLFNDNLMGARVSTLRFG